MTDLQTLFDATQWLAYFPDKLNTRKVLWYVADILDVDYLEENAVTLDFGAGFHNFKDCLPFLKAFPGVFVAIEDKEIAGCITSALEEHAPSVPVILPREGAFGGSKSVREVLQAGGQEAVDRLLVGAKERPIQGVLNLADVEEVDLLHQPTVLSGIYELDKRIGGFYGSELSIWTGKRGGGKSTLLGQILLEAVNQGHTVCAYSGELSAWRFKSWIMLQAAGADNIEATYDRLTDKTFYGVRKEAKRKINEWWDGKFYLYDNKIATASDENSIIEMFEFVERRYGACVFLVDNLMTARFSTSKDSDFYRAQSNFTGRLVEFAKKYECHVHLVAHPRKTQNLNDADDVGGSGDITNRADNVFSLERLSEKEARERGYQTVLRVLKNRSFGETVSIGMNYDDTSRRFYKADGNPHKKYKWEAR